MKIVICGSMSASRQMLEIRDALEKLGHQTVLPRGTEDYVSNRKIMESRWESARNKIENDLIKDYYNKISDADAVIIANFNKNDIKNYIGGNSFLEAGFAHVLNKKIYFINDIPEMIYKDELIAFQPIILNGDFSKIK